MHGKRLDAGRYLSSSRSARVRVEGNCNERGGREHYYLALGQKRAEVVRRWLVPTGAYGSALEAVSCGNYRPADPGHDELARAMSRRAEINYAAR
jgi:peptidoglycan-associated lipoprotein